ncbi:MAG: methyltransferase domain-containing protein, partial [Bacteroidota bacterium]
MNRLVNDCEKQNRILFSCCPFDAVADQYDQEFTHTDVGLLQRQLVYQQVEQLLSTYEISRVLELNCGTGEDAVWLAKKGLNVHATDISPKMVAVAQKKGDDSDIGQGMLTYQTLDCNQLSALGDRKFDLI